MLGGRHQTEFPCIYTAGHTLLWRWIVYSRDTTSLRAERLAPPLLFDLALVDIVNLSDAFT